MKKLFYLIILFVLIYSCKKDYSEPNPEYISPTRDITYQVIAVQKATVNIWCATNDPSTLLPDGSVQFSNGSDYLYWDTHIKIKKGEKYYLKAYYNNHIRPEYYYKVMVFCDGNLINSIATAFHQLNPDSTITFLPDTFAKYQTVILEGIVPK